MAGGSGKQKQKQKAAGVQKPGSEGSSSKKDAASSKKKGGSSASQASSSTSNMGQLEPKAPQLFDGWTGKTPVTQLNEYVQRQAGWNRADYNMSGSSGAGFQCSVQLTKPDAKNKSTPLSVLLRPPSALWPRQKTAIEARHMAATYALYRLRSDTNLHRTLPPVHRAYWMELQDNREPDPEWRYAADPFAAQQLREQQKKEKERVREKQQEKRARAEAGHREELLRPALRARWEEIAEARMAERHRLAVEAVVRTWTTRWEVDQPADQDACAPEELVHLGFRRAHALEALQHVRSLDRAVEWLLVHVPEDDLPPQMQRRLGETPEIVPQGARGRALKRLAACGFPRAAVRAALQGAMGSSSSSSSSSSGSDSDDTSADFVSQAEALAADALLAQLCARAPLARPNASLSVDAAAQQALAEEFEALQAIFGDAPDRVVLHGPCSLNVAFQAPDVAYDDLKLEVWVPSGVAYPDEQPPVFALSSTKMPAFLRLHVARQLASSVRCDGLPVVFEAVSLVKEHLAAWIAEPPPLAQLMPQQSQQTLDSAEEATPDTKKQSTRRRGRGAPSASDIAKLVERFKAQQLEPAYQRMQTARAQLPAHAKRQDILAALASHPCAIVSGATGCGKTTQVPQFILDDALARGEHANIICTQPRRISALGVAARVSEERAESSLGSGMVGYAVRGESRQGADTRLLFCTTGVLLRMLSDAPALEGVTHVVCDEVHERSVDSDLLLALLRRCQKERRNGLKVVLMSATAQSSAFAGYFGDAPVVDIPGRTFPVDDVYLEDLAATAAGPCEDERALGALFGSAAVGRARARLQTVRQRIAQLDEGNKLLEDARQWIARVDDLVASMSGSKEPCGELTAACLALWDDRYGHSAGASSAHSLDTSLVGSVVARIHRAHPAELSVLVFVPGAQEIRDCIEQIRESLALERDSLLLLPLHAGLTPAEQRRVFVRPPRGVRKVVVSTNLAETSITIDDIGFVIDTGRVRELRPDPSSGIARLVTVFCSQAAATQRRGRAGRMQRGTCFRLYTRATQKVLMPAYAEPEILRTPLEQVCLQAKAQVAGGDSLAFLRTLLTAPEPAAVERAERLLAIMGACAAPSKPLTHLGRMMAAIPADLRLAKMLIYAAMFGVLEQGLVLAALMAQDRPLFSAPFERRDDAMRERMRFATSGELSDWIADMRAYEFASREKSRAAGLEFVSRAAVRDVGNTVRTLRDALRHTGLSSLGSASAPPSDDDSDAAKVSLPVLRAVIFAGLSPHIARVRMPKQKYYEIIGGSAVGKEHEAKELSFYTVDPLSSPADWQTHDRSSDRRVFVHPQSTLFSETRFASTPFVTYFSMTQTSSSRDAGGKGPGKVYMRDVTVPGLYALLMFGPAPLSVDNDHKVIMIGDTGALAVRAWPRVAALVNHLRQLLDELLRRKLADPTLDISSHPVVETVVQLIQTDGH
ncbi:helicase [Coemansia sp. Benny D115]|nr:helicase [Coemansia sp. Benny D115]